MQHSPGMRRQEVRDHWSDEAMYSNTPLRTQLAVEIQTTKMPIGMNISDHPFAVVSTDTGCVLSRFSNLICASRTAADLARDKLGMYHVENTSTGQVYDLEFCLHTAERSPRVGGRS